MKQVFVLTPEQVEKLKMIEATTSRDVDIIKNLATDSQSYTSIKIILDRIESHCNELKELLG